MGHPWTKRMYQILPLYILFQLSLCYNAFSMSPDQGKTKITLFANNRPRREVLRSIEKQAKVTFFYARKYILMMPENLTIHVTDRPLEEVLKTLLGGTNLDWEVQGNVIWIKEKKKDSLLKATQSEIEPDSSINSIVVSGKVTATDGTPIPGATIRIKRTGSGATTDAEGNFSIPETKNNDILLISSIGFQSRQINVKGKSIRIQLAIDVSKLDETVVIAYGTTTKRYNTGNIITVKGDDIQKQPVSNPLASLQGRVSGMIVTQQTGVPGGGFNVQIRGKSSIANGNDPLYIVDGVPYTSTLLRSTQGDQIFGTSENGSVGSPFSYINPADIERIEVLKDADATAIYGSRGANGVIIITTKKGKPGKTKVDINFYSGAGKVPHFVNLMNTPEYVNMRKEAFKNDNVIPDAANAYDILEWDTTKYTDWQKKLIGGTARYTDIQASISGGSENVQYLFGGGLHKESTVFPGDFSDQKASAHFSLNTVSNNQKFKSIVSLNYVANKNNLTQFDLISKVTYAPNSPSLYNSDGTLNWANSLWINPLASLNEGLKTNARNLISNLVLSYEIIKDLEIKVSAGFTNMQIDQIGKTPFSSIDPANWSFSVRSSNFTNNSIESWIIEPQLTYKVRIGKGNLDVLLGTTLQNKKSTGSMVTGAGFASDDLMESLSGASSITKGVTVNNVYKYNAAFARLNYNLLDKYLINLTARRDGSSRFGPGKQFANFGAIGAAWIFSNESFLKNTNSFLSFGKLRGSYGTTGNDQIGDYRFLDTYNSTYYPYQDVQGLIPAGLFNPNFAWEINKKLEFGIELGFLQDRIYLTGSWYRNRSSNQLVGYNIPSITGATSVLANLPATVENNGIEFTLNSENVKGKTFTWSSSFNLTIPKNKLVAYQDFENSPYFLTYVIGEPLGIIRAFRYKGVNPQTGVYEFFDNKGNATSNPAYVDDQTVLINTAPKFYGGLQNSFNYKGIQLDIFFQFTKQVGRNNLFYTPIVPGYAGFFNQPIEINDRWQSKGDIKNVQKVSQNYGSDASRAYTFIQKSDYGYVDASFIRLKNVALSYQIPQNWRSNLHIQGCRIYIQGQNLLTFTKDYLGFDPETQSVNNLPPLRVWAAGIQLTL